MKTSAILISAIFGLMLLSGAVMACGGDYCQEDLLEVSILSPDDDETTGSSVVIVAEATYNGSINENITCIAMVYLDEPGADDSDTVYLMNYSGGTYTALITGLSPSDSAYEVEIKCNIAVNGCNYEEEDLEHWYVEEPPAIPEFPTSVAPVILSMLSIGLVRMKYK
ncbi:MAG: hypothetical protein ABIF85_07835 [Nanoarchaeota archaeon]|nr:hypothetical protein [Nanoarchaeota archaeon]MBU4300450.1 hypothetical protein [Nanoarchaeota archaeon]MBU4451665.1 hypothetical protein [Nanoarchaeota archaeon]MCG2723399.1 hypothetical protein [archaeon]